MCIKIVIFEYEVYYFFNNINIEYSNNQNDQKCISCIDGKLFQEDKRNCLDICPDGYIQNDNKCQKCSSNFYFNYTDKQCYLCDDNCNTSSSRKENEMKIVYLAKMVNC